MTLQELILQVKGDRDLNRDLTFGTIHDPLPKRPKSVGIAVRLPGDEPGKFHIRIYEYRGGELVDFGGKRGFLAENFTAAEAERAFDSAVMHFISDNRWPSFDQAEAGILARHEKHEVEYLGEHIDPDRALDILKKILPLLRHDDNPWVPGVSVIEVQAVLTTPIAKILKNERAL